MMMDEKIFHEGLRSAEGYQLGKLTGCWKIHTGDSHVETHWCVPLIFARRVDIAIELIHLDI